MINLLHAEWLKLRGRWLTSLLTIATLPVLAFVLLNLLAIAGLIGAWEPSMEAINWQEQVILALLFANQLVSQSLFIILAAVSIGGEYHWNTLQYLLPRTGRNRLIIAKCVVLMLTIIIVIQATALMTLIGSWEIALAIRLPLTTGSWNDADTGFGQQYMWLTTALFFNFLVAGLYSMICTIATRSTIAGIILAVLIAFADLFLQQAFGLIGIANNGNPLTWIPRLLPNYNVQNIMQWIVSGATFDGSSPGLSTVLLCSWVITGITISIFLLQRQDID